MPASDLSEIVVPGRKGGTPCLILDISAQGARLEVSHSDLPKRFMLVNYTSRTRTLCRLVWQQSRHIGVEFLCEPKPFELA